MTNQQILELMGGIESICKARGPQGLQTLYYNCWRVMKDYLYGGTAALVTHEPYTSWLSGFTARKLSEKLGCSRSHAYRIQQGTMPSVTLAFAIMRESGYSLETILGGKPNGLGKDHSAEAE